MSIIQLYGYYNTHKSELKSKFSAYLTEIFTTRLFEGRKKSHGCDVAEVFGWEIGWTRRKST